MKDWRQDPRYWGYVHTKGGFWTSGINANGLDDERLPASSTAVSTTGRY